MKLVCNLFLNQIPLTQMQIFWSTFVPLLFVRSFVCFNFSSKSSEQNFMKLSWNIIEMVLIKFCWSEIYFQFGFI